MILRQDIPPNKNEYIYNNNNNNKRTFNKTSAKLNLNDDGQE